MSGYGVLNAHALFFNHANSISEMSNVEQEATFQFASNNQAFISLPDSESGEQHYSIEVSVVESEEDDLASEKNFFTSERFLAETLHDFLAGYFSTVSSEEHYPVLSHSLAQPERIYVLFGVFRL